MAHDVSITVAGQAVVKQSIQGVLRLRAERVSGDVRLTVDSADGTITSTIEQLDVELNFDPDDLTPPQFLIMHSQPENNYQISVTLSGSSEQPSSYFIKTGSDVVGVLVVSPIPKEEETHSLVIGGSIPTYTLSVTVKRK